MVNNVLFLEIIEGYFFRVFQGLPLFGRLLLFVFDKVPRAMLIWGATTIRQVRVLNCPIFNLVLIQMVVTIMVHFIQQVTINLVHKKD